MTANLNLNCKSVQKRLATSWGYIKKEDDTMTVKKLSISYMDDDSERTITKFYDELAPWSDMVQDFCKFLESAGYIRVLEKTGIKDSPFVDYTWQGAVMYEDGTWSDVQSGDYS